MSLTKIINWKNELESATFDEAVGIKVAKLIEGETSTFITVIDPRKKVNPHYHSEGNEHYHIISGRGIIKLQELNTNNIEEYEVYGGDSFVIEPNVIHELSNTSNDDLVLMFSCNNKHLTTDRNVL
jgi:mannose-6-phosphate isomerase-like protein (cupin superfamily)